MREDWIGCKFGDIITFKNGYAFKSTGYLKSGIPVIRIGDIKENEVLIEDAICVDENKDLKEYEIVKDDILIAMSGATTGKFGRYNLNDKAYLNQRVGNIKPLSDKYIYKSFLYYLLSQLKREIERSAYGGAQPNISSKKIEELTVAFAPLPEQRAIVKKLESLFSSLDAGVADLKKAQQQLKIYRQTVLKKAFEGEWDKKKIIETCSNIKVGIVIKPTQFYSSDNSGIKVFRSANVKEFRIQDSNWVYFSLQGNEINKRTQVKEDDVLVVRTGYPGTSCIVTKEYVDTNAIDILIATPDKNIILPKYLCAFNNSPYGKGLFSEGSRGVAQKHLNVGVYSNLIIPVPPVKNQHEIIKQLESGLSVCDSIEENIKESLVKSESLRQSILKKAFEGNLLTAQELAECKQAADYEPASVLLEWIKAEQNKATAKPSKKKVAQPLIVAKTETPVVKISADIHAGLIAKVIKIHEENPASIDNLSHIKCEKIAHLVEYHLQIPLGRQPVKDAAGPDDYPHLKKIEHRAKMANYFAIQKRDIGYSYSSTRNSDKAIEKIQSAISAEMNKQLDDLIALFLNFDLEASEIIATTYAGWNNLILSGNANPSDEEIVYESRENWSERKLKIARERFFKAIEWIRKNEIVPTGYGAVVPFPKKKK
ncbi:MAG: restriction endonuclease subunit S [Pedobacter sp.]